MGKPIDEKTGRPKIRAKSKMPNCISKERRRNSKVLFLISVLRAAKDRTRIKIKREKWCAHCYLQCSKKKRVKYSQE